MEQKIFCAPTPVFEMSFAQEFKRNRATFISLSLYLSLGPASDPTHPACFIGTGAYETAPKLAVITNKII